MHKYRVPVTRGCTETAYVEVKADDKDEAMEKAIEKANAEPLNLKFEQDDGSGDDDVYIADDSGEGIINFCDDCGVYCVTVIGCPDGAEICQACFDAGKH